MLQPLVASNQTWSLELQARAFMLPVPSFPNCLSNCPRYPRPRRKPVTFAVLVYVHNVLVRLGAMCGTPALENDPKLGVGHVEAGVLFPKSVLVPGQALHLRVST